MRHSEQFLDCLVEGDAARVALARRNRAVALCLSAATQVLLLGVALAVPLAVTAERPRINILTPIPPYTGRHAAEPQPARQRGVPSQPGPRRFLLQGTILYQPPHIPAKVARVNDAGEAPAPPGWLPGVPGDPNGVLPPIPGLDTHGWSPALPTPMAPKASAPLRVSEGVQQARLLRQVKPVYPTLAVQARLEGTVVLRAMIGRDGSVREVSLVNGPPLFVREAIAAVQQWRYQPTLLNGEAVEVETLITVIFKLQR